MPLKIKTYVYCLRLCTGELGSHLDLPQRRGDLGEAGHWPLVAMIVFPSPVSPGLSLSSESAHCHQMSQMTEHSLLGIIDKMHGEWRKSQ